MNEEQQIISVDSMYFRKLTTVDFQVLWGLFKPQSGGGQTYIDATKIADEEWGRFFNNNSDSVEIDNTRDDNRPVFTVNLKSVSDGAEKKVKIEPRGRRNYKISGQFGEDKRHPIFSVEKGFPTPEAMSQNPNFSNIVSLMKSGVMSDEEIEEHTQNLKLLISKGISQTPLYIYILRTITNEYYFGFDFVYENREFALFDDFVGLSTELDITADTQIIEFSTPSQYDVKSHQNFDWVNIAYKNVQAAIVESTTDHDHDELLGLNVLYAGAPGTGKSFEVDKLIRNIYPNYEDDPEQSQCVVRTTFYADYSYYDFVGSIQPVREGGEILYKFVPGVFVQALERAIRYPGKNIFLVLEEISRANVSAVFGEVFQLLDRTNGVSDYPISNANIVDYLRESGLWGDMNSDLIRIPNNLSIIGTVNTSDQNVYVMDTAFKRRWDYEVFSTNPVKKSDGYINDFVFEVASNKVRWIPFYQAVNKFITVDLHMSEDKQIGQFFLKNLGEFSKNQKQVEDKLLMYLWDDIEKLVVMTSMGENRLFSGAMTFTDLRGRFATEATLNPKVREYYDNLIFAETTE